MTMRDALKKAKEIVRNRADVSAHYGDNKRTDRAVRITGCFADEAESIGFEIAEGIDGTLATQAGFVCVWL